MEQYFAELQRRFGDGFDADGALDDAAVAYNPPHGLFVLAVSDDAALPDDVEPVGCGALHLLDTTTAEVKRMWVSPNCRGAGLGARLVNRLEDEARLAGRSRIVLDTNASLTEAIALYRRRGYVPIPRYNDNPYAQCWFAKDLARPTDRLDPTGPDST
jgi:GNAT superfamily N-acetyltransferase